MVNYGWNVASSDSTSSVYTYDYGNSALTAVTNGTGSTNVLSLWGAKVYSPAPWTVTPVLSDQDLYEHLIVKNGRVAVPKRQLQFDLPDGSVLRVDDQGNFTLDDSRAKRVYAANRNLDFNPYLNASDLVARFLTYLAGLGLKRIDVQSIPVTLFIDWLIIEAAKADDDPVPEGVKLLQKPTLRLRSPQCQTCGRFIKKTHAEIGFFFCTPEHAMQRLKAA